MPKINSNGIVREMTAEEIAEMEQLVAQAPVEETVEEKMAKIEQLYAEIRNMLGVKD